MIPIGLGEEFMGEGKNIYESYRMMDMGTRQQVLKHTVKMKNKFASKRMLLSHVISISPWLNAKYAVQKLNKRWKFLK